MRYAWLLWVSVGLTVTVLAGGAWMGYADDPQVKEEGEGEPESFWMRKKLEYTQNILSGLALEDFDAIQKNAHAMRRLSRVEGFVRRTHVEGYRTQLKVFEFSNEEIARLAGERNIDGAALAFAQMTISCVNCHKHLRSMADE